MKQNALNALRDYFGYESFRKGQDKIIESVLAGRDTLGVMPTGGGKSLCYQIPALCFSGVTVVISPLISLMKDQIDSLTQRGYPAAMLNSTVSPEIAREVMESVLSGRIKLLYLTPERFRSQRFLEWLKGVELSLFAVDEAHCISEWGHDFRPDYRRLSAVRKFLNNPPVLALTATATEDVRADIVNALGMTKPEIVINGFNRENLIYGVKKFYRTEDKKRGLLEFMQKVKVPGIIYTASVKDADEIYNYLRTNSKLRFACYHARLDKQVRNKAQDDFLQNKIDVLIATNAFGMGVNKPDIRFVAHYSIPGTIEAYYQETGRAGRDGKISFCLLQYMEQDVKIQQFFIDSKHPPLELLRNVLAKLVKMSKKRIVYEDDELEGEKISVHAQTAVYKILQYMGCIDLEYIREEVLEIELNHPPKGWQLDYEGLCRFAAGKKSFSITKQKLARRLDMNLGQLNETLSQLEKEKCISVAKLRAGRRVKVLENKINPEQEKEYCNMVNKKIRVDYAKLDALIKYVQLESNDCRRRDLLSYFGEKYEAENCATCDLCRKTFKVDKPKLSGVEKKILMSVYLADVNFGKKKLALFFKGSFELDERFHELDDFGALSKLDVDEIAARIDELVDMGFLYVDIGKYPVVKISADGRKVLQEAINK